jgi:hypothetical protein
VNDGLSAIHYVYLMADIAMEIPCEREQRNWRFDAAIYEKEL